MKNLLYALLITIFTIQAHEFDFSELVKDQSESVVNIQSIRKVKRSNPEAVTIMTGCYAERDKDKIKEINEKML